MVGGVMVVAVVVEAVVAARVVVIGAVVDHPAADADRHIAVQKVADIGEGGALMRDAESEGDEHANEGDHPTRPHCPG